MKLRNSLLEAILFTPFFASFYSCAVVALFHIVRKNVQQTANEVVTFAAILQTFIFATGLYGTTISPERLVRIHAAFATRCLAKTAFGATKSAP